MNCFGLMLINGDSWRQSRESRRNDWLTLFTIWSPQEIQLVYISVLLMKTKEKPLGIGALRESEEMKPLAVRCHLV